MDGLPYYTFKVTTIEKDNTKCASSTAREQNQLLQDKRKADRERENDTFNSLDELAMKLDMGCLPLDIVTSRSKSNVMFLAICHEEKPNINYCLKLDEFLYFVMWCKGEHSDAFFVLCVHAYMMFSFILNGEQRKNVLLSTSNPRTVFINTFIQRFDDDESTCVILKSECHKGHKIRPFIKRAVCTMFNIFSIHKKRKRTVALQEAP